MKEPTMKDNLSVRISCNNQKKKKKKLQNGELVEELIEVQIGKQDKKSKNRLSINP
jgi:hypothetical protein